MQQAIEFRLLFGRKRRGSRGVAFLGAAGWTNDLVLKVLITQWVLKVSWEAILTPVTYAVVGFLKRREGLDVYDRKTDFTPFKASV